MLALPQTDSQNLHWRTCQIGFWFDPSSVFILVRFLTCPPCLGLFRRTSVCPLPLPSTWWHCRGLPNPWGCSPQPPITERPHGKELCESEEKSKQLEILSPESRQGSLDAPPPPRSTCLSRFQAPRPVSWSQFWLELICVFSIKCSEAFHTRLGLGNLVEPVLFSLGVPSCETLCFPNGELLYEEFWNPGTVWF